MNPNEKSALRWRLMLGRYAKDSLQPEMDTHDQRMDAALEFLYRREYTGRGVLNRKSKSSGATLDPSQLTVPAWIREVRQLFPKAAAEKIVSDGVNRYRIKELLSDPETLKTLTADANLLKAILMFKGSLAGPALIEARRIVKKVAEEIRAVLEKEIQIALSGRAHRFRASNVKSAANFDWKKTIRANLKNFNPDLERIIVEKPRFFSRRKQQVPWELILCVDQSGSMLDSVIHSAIMAGIFARLPALDVRLVVFDTAIVDLTAQAEDPLEILMKVQLGGGTNIGAALRYCEQQIKQPRRSILILVSDFEEGAPLKDLCSTVNRLNEAGVKLIGLASLDRESEPHYDHRTASMLAAHGMNIAALTPGKLAEWIAQLIS